MLDPAVMTIVVKDEVQWETLVGVAAAVLIALFGSRVYESVFGRSNLIFSEGRPKPILQVATIYYRLLVTNTGRARAKNVEAVVTKVTTNGKQVEPFLPSPLRWTHKLQPETLRDIQRNQPVNLDLVEYHHDKDNDRWILSLLSPPIQRQYNLSSIDTGKSTVTINLYQDSGQVIEVTVDINWDGKKEPSITQIKQMNRKIKLSKDPRKDNSWLTKNRYLPFWIPFWRYNLSDIADDEELIRAQSSADKHPQGPLGLRVTEKTAVWGLLYAQIKLSQIHPTVVRHMRRADLEYIAGMKDGPPDVKDSELGKLRENVARASAELARRNLWRTSIASALIGALIGASATLITAN